MSATVLIVDDNARFRVRARRWLEADGYAVVAEAADGAAALEAVRLHRPAVVLTSTHDAADFGEALARCGARGFVPKAELSGDRLSALLNE